MACRLVGAKPLSEPMLKYCKFDPKEQILGEMLIEIHTPQGGLMADSTIPRSFKDGLFKIILLPILILYPTKFVRMWQDCETIWSRQS